MGETQELPSDINGLKIEEEKTPENAETNKIMSSSTPRKYKWWIQMVIYSFLVLAGQSVGTLLGRLYFDNGGKSEWMATLVQLVGFPVLFPFQWLTTTKGRNPTEGNKRFPLNLAVLYTVLGIFVAADCMLYSIGLQYLPVTTYTLLCASQLGFNALFSFFLNNQKFTPYIVNSLVLLTISSVLLVFQADPGDSNKSSKNKYTIGFLSTIGASAGYALMLSITQLAFHKIIKKDTVGAIVDMTIFQSLVGSILIVAGIFGSGDWKKLHGEMETYKTGRVSYVMNLFWTAVSWQAFSIGCVGLIFKVSSLFSNVISVLGLPVAPVLAVLFLHDKLTGLKAVSMMLAVWGFVSYMCQHYLDDLEMKRRKMTSSDDHHQQQASEVALINERGR